MNRSENVVWMLSIVVDGDDRMNSLHARRSGAIAKAKEFAVPRGLTEVEVDDVTESAMPYWATNSRDVHVSVTRRDVQS